MIIKDLGHKTNIEVINRYAPVEGKFVVDAGCGSMALTIQLAERRARVLAVDPDPVQAEFNRQMLPIDNVKFVEAGADQLPVESSTMDGIFFSYSLHHIPSNKYPAVFDEVKRVLNSDGFLYVIEPTGCPLNDVMKLFHDEEEVRADAQRALHELAIPLFSKVDVVQYHSFREFDSFEDFVQQFSSRTFNTGYTEQDVRHPDVEEAFKRLGGSDLRFSAPKQVMVLHGPRTTPVS